MQIGPLTTTGPNLIGPLPLLDVEKGECHLDWRTRVWYGVTPSSEIKATAHVSTS